MPWGDYPSPTSPTNSAEEAYLDILAPIAVESIRLHEGTGIDAAIAIDFLTLDDDDAYLNNGTPHFDEICAGFEAHGIQCPYRIRHNGSTRSGGSGERAVDFWWKHVPLVNWFTTARQYHEGMGHVIEYDFSRTHGSPVFTWEFVRNDSAEAWRGFRIELIGSDFFGVSLGLPGGPLARADNPVVPNTGVLAGDIFFVASSSAVELEGSDIVRDGENASLNMRFSGGVGSGGGFVIAYWIGDVGIADGVVRVVETPQR